MCAFDRYLGISMAGCDCASDEWDAKYCRGARPKRAYLKGDDVIYICTICGGKGTGWNKQRTIEWDGRENDE